MDIIELVNMNMKKLQRMNGTECRPRAPVAEGGPEPYEGSFGDAPKTLFIFLVTPYPLR
jgi:hypothetical protein